MERERECVLIYCVVLDFTSFYGKRRPAPVDMREWCVYVCVCEVHVLGLLFAVISARVVKSP